MAFKPLHDRILLKPVAAETRTKGGLIIPDTAQEKPMQGEVIAAGPGARDEQGKIIPPDVEAGDRVLKVVARTLAEISDDRCHVARHGGEEFVVLFRGKTLRQSYETLDATRETLANRKLVNRATDTPFGQVSFSGGLADIFAFRDQLAKLVVAHLAVLVGWADAGLVEPARDGASHHFADIRAGQGTDEFHRCSGWRSGSQYSIAPCGQTGPRHRHRAGATSLGGQRQW